MRLKYRDFDCAYLHLSEVVSESHTQQTTDQKPDKYLTSVLKLEYEGVCQGTKEGTEDIG